jgi:hypothetical protein
MKDHHWGGQGWNSAVEPQEVPLIFRNSYSGQTNCDLPPR